MLPRTRRKRSAPAPDEPVVETWDGRDFAESHWPLAGCRLHAAKSRATKGPFAIRWDGKIVSSAWIHRIPRHGRISLVFKSLPTTPLQGVDLILRGRGIRLEDGTEVRTLRTFNAPEFEPRVTYPYSCRDGRLVVRNVYNAAAATNSPTDHSGGNSGMIREAISGNSWRFGASPGWARAPDFSAMIFELEIEGADARVDG